MMEKCKEQGFEQYHGQLETLRDELIKSKQTLRQKNSLCILTNDFQPFSSLSLAIQRHQYQKHINYQVQRVYSLGNDQFVRWGFGDGNRSVVFDFIINVSDADDYESEDEYYDSEPVLDDDLEKLFKGNDYGDGKAKIYTSVCHSEIQLLPNTPLPSVFYASELNQFIMAVPHSPNYTRINFKHILDVMNGDAQNESSRVQFTMTHH